MNRFSDLPGPLGKRSRLGWRWRQSWPPVAALITEFLPRLLDIVLALAMLLLLAPLLYCSSALFWPAGGLAGCSAAPSGLAGFAPHSGN